MRINKDPFEEYKDPVCYTSLWNIISSKQFHNNIKWNDVSLVESHRDAFVELFDAHMKCLINDSSDNFCKFSDAFKYFCELCESDVSYDGEIRCLEFHQSLFTKESHHSVRRTQVVFLSLMDKTLYDEIKRSTRFTDA